MRCSSSRLPPTLSPAVSPTSAVSGVLHNDETVENHTRGGHEKFSRISSAQGKELQHVDELHAGDIGVVAKLKDTLSGDSLGAKDSPVEFPKAEILPGHRLRH
ncbi:MAG: hypothetical protein R2748_09235 [Bryobacterales bacterium]